jgi:cellulose synthase operon protein C
MKLLALTVNTMRYAGYCFPLVLAAAVLAAEGPPDGAAAHFEQAETLRLHATFADAAREFDAAASAFAARPENGKNDLEWMFCARCAEAEMLLRAQKLKEARAVLEPLLKDPRLADSSYHGLALFYHGAACSQLGDDMAAGRSLDRLAPFDDVDFGAAARRLLARIHERAGERAEALAQYEAIDADYAERKKAAPKAPTPDVVNEARFAAAVLHYENGQFDKAHDLFAELTGAAPPALATGARLYQGCCEVQLRQFAQAVETLTPLRDANTLQGAQALLWLGRATAGGADPEDADARREGLQNALKMLGRAEEKFKAAGDDGRFASARRAEALREGAEVHERLGQFTEAADLYARMRADRVAPERDEETLQREVTARTLAGDPAASEKLAALFEQTYPRSVLAAEIHLRRGENASLLAVKEASAEAVRRFQLVLDKYPEFEHAQNARFSLAWLFYLQGDYDKTRSLLEEIPTTDRKDDLAGAGYLLADCLIRTTPKQTDDALAAGKAQEQLTQAAALLTDVVMQQPYAGRTTDALMRLGLCQQRLAALAGKDEERNALNAASRATFERVLLEYPQDELQPHAALERARWIRRGGDIDEAVRRLRPFSTGTLENNPLAPLAVLHLGGYMRGQEGKAPEAAKLLARCRRKYDKVLRADPARAEWAPLLRYQYALALQDAGRFVEARALLKEVMEEKPARPEAVGAPLAWGNGLLAEGVLKIVAADQAAQAPPTEADAAAARKDRAAGIDVVRAGAEYLESQARQMGDKASSPILQSRLFYEAAWAWRGVAGEEVKAARARIQEERKKGDPTEVPLSDVPQQPAEKKALAAYEGLIAAQPELLPLAAQARLELAETRIQRGEPPAAAVTLLKQALDLEPAPDLSARIGLRLADCLFTAGDAVGGLRQLDRVGSLSDTPLAPVARYRAAAWIAGRGEWDKVVARLTPFRDEDALKKLDSVTDKALLLLGQAYAALGQDAPSTQAYQQMLTTFPDSGWRRQAHYGEALNLQKQKKYPEAVTAYLRAYSLAPPDVAVRARIQIGVCEVEMGQYAEAVETLLAAFDPDFPDMNAFALREAAYAQAKLGSPEEVNKKKGIGDDAPHARAEAAKLLTLGLQPPAPLDPLGEQQAAEPTVFDDLLDRACQAAILARPLALRPIPSPLLRLNVPEPFEHRGTVRVGALSAVEDLPPVAPLRTPRP